MSRTPAQKVKPDRETDTQPEETLSALELRRTVLTPEVLRICGFSSYVSLWRAINDDDKDKRFPPPFKITGKVTGRGRNGWRLSKVLAWVEKRERAAENG